MLKDSDLQIERNLDRTGRTAPDLGLKREPVKGRGWWLVAGLCLVVALVVLGLRSMRQRRAAVAPKQASGAPGRPGAFPVAVVAGTVVAQDFPLYLDGLGTVQAFNTVTVRSRVDGQIDKILFTEGQDVHAGDLLVQIDAAPFQAQVDQYVAKKAEDQAQLAVAKLTLKRDADLLANKILAQQDYDTQEALVQQLEATVMADEAAAENARVQLNYTHITSPLDGRVGIRLQDQGNIVHANDSNGIVVITQLRPIAVIFTVSERFLGDIQQHAAGGEPLSVVALDRNNRTKLAEGKLAVIDNQIDTTTGTIRLKAVFSNDELHLWPGQFINPRLLLTVVKGALVVPAQVIQRGPEQSSYVFVINKDDTVSVRSVKVAQLDQGLAWVSEGLALGDRVVVDGQAKLQPGSRIRTSEGPSSGQGGQRGNRPGGKKPEAP